MKIGDKIKYTKAGETKISVIISFGHHQTFIEVILENGDSIADTQIVEIL